MEIKKFNYQKNQVIQIYISKKEEKNPRIIEKINKIKKEYCNITIFVSGENETIKTIEELLNYEKSKTQK